MVEETHLRTLIPKASKPIDLVEELRRSEKRHPCCLVKVVVLAGGVWFDLLFDTHQVEESDETLQVDLGAISFDSASDGRGVWIETSNPSMEIARFITPSTRLVMGGGKIEKIYLTHAPEPCIGRWSNNRCSLWR